jgi:hypothetical protein
MVITERWNIIPEMKFKNTYEFSIKVGSTRFSGNKYFRSCGVWH